MGKLSEIPDKNTPLLLAAPMIFVDTLLIKVLLLEETLVGLVVVEKKLK